MPRKLRPFQSIRDKELTLPLKNDLRMLEDYLANLEDRVSRLTPGESLNRSIVNQNIQSIGKHAFTHSTGQADPIDPYSFTWTNQHIFVPKLPTYIPLTISPTSSHTADLVNINNPDGDDVVSVEKDGKTNFRDAANNGIVNIKGGSFTPTDIASLEMWYTVSSISQSDNTKVTSWSDSSGNGRDLTLTGGGASNPVYRTSGSNAGDPVQTMPHAVVWFKRAPGDNPAMTLSSDYDISSGNFTIIALTMSETINVGAGEGSQIFSGFSSSVESWISVPAYVQSGSTSRTQWKINNSTKDYADNTDEDDHTVGGEVVPFVWSVKFDVTGSTATMNGVWLNGDNWQNQSTDPVTGITASVLINTLFARKTGSSSYSQDGIIVTEFLLFNTELSDTDRQKIENYIASQYNLDYGSLDKNASNLGGTEDQLQFQDASQNVLSRFNSNAELGIGVDPDHPLHIRSTSQQISVDYDSSNYLDLSILSDGEVSLDAVGTGAEFTFKDPVVIENTSSQLQLEYDASNYSNIAVKSDGEVELNTTNIPKGFTFKNRVGIINTADSPYILHLNIADSGASAHSFVDDFVIENDGDTGMSILTPNNERGGLYFGDPEKSNAGQIYYQHSEDWMWFYTDATASVIIDNNQFVGINQFPSARLHIADASNSQLILEGSGGNQLDLNVDSNGDLQVNLDGDEVYFNTLQLKELVDPTDSQDAVTLNYLDNNFISFVSANDNLPSNPSEVQFCRLRQPTANKGDKLYVNIQKSDDSWVWVHIIGTRDSR